MPQEIRPLQFTGGVNRTVDPQRLADNEAYTLQNLIPDLSGRLNKRLGTKFSSALPDPTSHDPEDLYPVNISFPPYTSSGIIFVGYDSNTDNYYVKVTNGTGTTEMDFEAVAGYRPQIIHFGSMSIIVTGTAQTDADPNYDGFSLILVTVNGSGQLSLSKSNVRFFNNSTAVAPKALAVYRRRLIYGNFGTGLDNLIIFSDRDDYEGLAQWPVGSVSRDTELSTSEFTLLVPGIQGDPLVAMVEVALQSAATALQSGLFILSEQKATMLTGEPELTTGIGPDYGGTAEFVEFPTTCGCCSRETIVHTPFGLVWANWNEVWGMQPGGMPQRLGGRIRTLLSADASNFRFLWHAVYHHDTGTYRLAMVPWGGPRYPACGEHWCLDLRNGFQNPVWYGPQIYNMPGEALSDPDEAGTFIAVTDSRQGQNNRIMACHRAYWDGSTTWSNSARHIVFVQLDLDEDTKAFDHSLHTELPAEQGNQVVTKIVTKRFDLNDPMHDKLYEGVEMQVYSNNLDSFDVTVSIDGGRASDTETIVLPLKEGTSEDQSILANPDAAKRMVGKQMQVTIEEKPGYYVPSEGEGSSLIVQARQTGDPSTYWPYYITLTAGYYATRDAYLDMIVAAINTQLDSGTIAHSVATGGYVKLTGTGLPEDGKWFPMYTDSDADLQASSIYVWGLLGFNTGSQPSGGTDFTASTVVPKKLSPKLELGNVNLKAYHFGRRPPSPRKESQID